MTDSQFEDAKVEQNFGRHMIIMTVHITFQVKKENNIASKINEATNSKYFTGMLSCYGIYDSVIARHDMALTSSRLHVPPFF